MKEKAGLYLANDKGKKIQLQLIFRLINPDLQSEINSAIIKSIWPERQQPC